MSEEKPRLPLKSIFMANLIEGKRQFSRIKLVSPLRFQVRGKPEYDNSVIDDISIGGLSFRNGKFIPPNTLLSLEMSVLSRALRAVGRVAWVNNLPFSDRFKLGVEFLELEGKDKMFLEDYINFKTE